MMQVCIMDEEKGSLIAKNGFKNIQMEKLK